MPFELGGLRVLVVEDSFLVAQHLQDVFEGCGCEIVGPASRVSSALKLAGESPLDGAILDINLAGEYCFPVAELLRERGVPFIFLTGYDSSTIIPPEFRKVPCLAKPFNIGDVKSIAGQMFGR